MNHTPTVGLNRALALLIVLPTFAACDGDGDGGYGDMSLMALDSEVQAPADNPMSEAKAELGRLLFFDPILSANGDVACGTCHIPEFAYADGLALSIGVGGTGLGPDRVPGLEFPNAGRNAPSLLNVAYNGLVGTGANFDPTESPMFWDNRILSLEAQVLEPIASAAEMLGGDVLPEDALPQAIARLSGIAEYVTLFEGAFGPGGIDETRLSHALATYLRTLVTPNSPFDLFMRGDETAMTEQQQEGMDLFDAADCTNCHNGQMFSDWSLKTLGVGPHPDQLETDFGAGSFDFRSVSLRNVELTAPYMHNGTLATLEEVIDFYVAGESIHPGVVSNDLEPQPATEEQKLALLAFLEALTDTDFTQDVPDTVPSGLPVSGAAAEL